MTRSCLVIALLALLSACSNGGGGGTENGFNKNFRHNEKPSNAASQEDVRYYLSLLKNSNQVLPADEALFEVIASGARAEKVSAEDRQQALKKLNGTGKSIHKAIKDSCKIDNAVETVVGDDGLYVGAKKVELAKMGLSGDSCIMRSLVQQENRTEILKADFNQQQQTAAITAALTQTTYSSRRMDHEDVRRASKLALIEQSLLSRGTITMNISQKAVSSSGKFEGSGQLRFDLADGDSIAGPLSFEAVIVNNKQSSQFLFEGQSRRGAVRLVQISSEGQTKVYINGVEVSSQDIGISSQEPVEAMTTLSKDLF